MSVVEKKIEQLDFKFEPECQFGEGEKCSETATWWAFCKVCEADGGFCCPSHRAAILADPATHESWCGMRGTAGMLTAFKPIGVLS